MTDTKKKNWSKTPIQRLQDVRAKIDERIAKLIARGAEKDSSLELTQFPEDNSHERHELETLQKVQGWMDE